MELTSGDHTLTGDRRAIFHWSCGKVDPHIPVFTSPQSPHTLCEGQRGILGIKGIGIGFGLRSKIQQVDIEPRGRIRALLLEILLDNAIDRCVRHRKEGRKIKQRWGGLKVGPDGVGYLRSEEREGGVKVQGVSDGEVVSGGADDVEAVRGEAGGGGEGPEEAGGRGGEVTHKLHVYRDGDMEREELGDKGSVVGGGEVRGKRPLEGRGKGREGIICGRGVAAGNAGEEGVEAEGRGLSRRRGREGDKGDQEEDRDHGFGHRQKQKEEGTSSAPRPNTTED